MKKLMTVIAAAAMSFGLFADALDNAWDASTKTETTWNEDELWIGDGLEAGATFVEGDSAAANYLQIKSPSAAVTRKINDDGAFTVASNVFFDVDLDMLGQVLDEVPEVATGTKLALFALDPAEIDTKLVNDPPAGLYAIAGAEDNSDAKVLYRLSADLEALTNGTKKITVKGYDNVLKEGVNAGFVVYTLAPAAEEATLVKIKAAYTVNADGSWTDLNFDEDAYLKGATITKLADKTDSVLLSLVGGVTGREFAGLDFLGNANVATVTMNETGFDYIPSDASDMIITLGDGITGVADPAGIWDETTGVVTGLGTITLSAEDKDIFKFAEEVDPAVASIAGDVLTISTLAPGEAFSVIATKSIATATIDGDEVKFDDVSELIAALASAGEASVVLADNITLGEEEVILTTGEVVIDLNGQTITGSGSADQAAVFYAESGSLTINDSEGGGKVAPDGEDVLAVQSGEADITINAGDYDGAFDLGDGSAFINGGRFVAKEGLDPEEGAAVTLPENKKWSEEPVEGYYILVDAQADIDIKDAVITLAADTIEFGEDAPAIVSVTVNDTPLTEDIDYTVDCTYTTGDNVGEYKYILTAVDGSGYKGTVEQMFDVEAKTVTPTITFDPDVEEATWAKDGSFPAVTVVAEGDEGTDYTKGWENDAQYPAENPEVPVTFTYTVTMQGNYTGSASKTFKVNPAAKPVDPVVPGTDIDVPAGKTQEQFLIEVNQNKATYLKAPYGETTTQDYLDCFTAVANGTDKVKFELNADGQKALEEIAENTIATFTADSTMLQVQDPIEGFYYSLKESTALETLDFDEQINLEASAATFFLDKTNDAGFWQIVITPAAVEVDKR